MTTALRALERTKVTPILFSGPMVRALIDGRKTMTRRILKPQPPPECSIHYMLGNESWLPENRRTPLRHSWEAWRGPLYDARPAKALAGGFEVRMPWTPGDLLWVRETSMPDFPKEFSYYDWSWAEVPAEYRSPQHVLFKASWTGYELTWHPSIHMPRWASRLTLEVTAVKVERLQEISEEDAIAEGVDAVSLADVPRQATWSRRHDFAQLWNSLNAKRAYGWGDNPWVCAISFNVHKMNVNAFLAQREAA